ncbi:unnamed protein product [Jaminaea pallidilutea]
MSVPSQPQDFHAQLHAILQGPLEVPESFADATDPETRLHAALFAKLQSFFEYLELCYDAYLTQQHDISYCISRLFDLPFFQEHTRDAATCILDLSNRAKTLPALLISYDVILAYGALDSDIYRILQTGVDGLARDKITRMVHQIWAGHYAAVAEASLGIRYTHAAHGTLVVEDEAANWASTAHTAHDMASTARTAQDETDQGNSIASRLSAASTSNLMPNAARVRLHQIRLRDKAVRLLYEVCRVQRLEPIDMRAIDDKFVDHLFDLVEDTRLHEDEAFNYQLIKLIAAINEQFMVSTITSRAKSKNVVMTILRSRLHVTKTFGENVIFMLNRAKSQNAEDACMQLLVLKLLYLLFTTSDTAHYFYTNDLKVLVDVFVRELSDLPEDSESLRHTYLRVLHPLMTNTQLVEYPYKRPQIRRLLRTMVIESLYHGDVSATTKRLVERCLDADWCRELDRLDPQTETPKHANPSTAASVPAAKDPASSRMRGVSISAAQSPAQSPAQSSDQTDLAAVARPASVLQAPRFQPNAARSAPSTPPPPPETPSHTDVIPAAEDEAAMALADGKTVADAQESPSWQSQIATSDTDSSSAHIHSSVHDQLSSERMSSSSLLPSSPSHRPVARRASHNEFKKPADKASSRRAPPPAPVTTRSDVTRSDGVSNVGTPSHAPSQQNSPATDDQHAVVPDVVVADDGAPTHGVPTRSRRKPPAPPTLLSAAVNRSLTLDGHEYDGLPDEVLETAPVTDATRRGSLPERSPSALNSRRALHISQSHPHSLLYAPEQETTNGHDSRPETPNTASRRRPPPPPVNRMLKSSPRPSCG